MEKVKKIKKLYEGIWLGLENVTAVGSGKTKDGRICLVISLICDDAATRNIFPREIENIPIEFRITGKPTIQ